MEAASLVIRLLGLIRDDKDPEAERATNKNSLTLADLAGRYMAEYAEQRKEKRSIEEDRRLRRLPVLGRLQVRVIVKADVTRFHASLHAKPVAANRSLALLSGMLGWAERIGERPDGSNPCRHVDRNPEKGRERFLCLAPDPARASADRTATRLEVFGNSGGLIDPSQSDN